MEPVTLQIGGRVRTLALDLNSIIAMKSDGDPTQLLGIIGWKQEIDKKTGLPIPVRDEKGNEVPEPSLGEKMRAMRMFLWCCLITDEPELEIMPKHEALARVGGWLSLDMMPEVGEALGKVVAQYTERVGKTAFREFPGQVAVYVPSPAAVVEAMVAMSGVGGMVCPEVYDLGAGDGRVMFCVLDQCESALVHGWELHEGRHEALAMAVKVNANHNRITLHNEDLLKADLTKPDVVFLYLSPMANEALRDRLMTDMKPGAVIITHDFVLRDWDATETRIVTTNDKPHKVFKYVHP